MDKADGRYLFETRDINRRRFVAAAAGFSATTLGMLGCARSTKSSSERNTAMTQVQVPTGGSTAVRPFPQLNYPDSELTELKRRVNATRWPTKELVADQSQGVQLATMQALARYWATEYDWRKCEAKLNAIPQFVTEIDGQDIHFIHVLSNHKNALPLIITHGWPGSIIEQTKVIDLLTNPTAHDASEIGRAHV